MAEARLGPGVAVGIDLSRSSVIVGVMATVRSDVSDAQEGRVSHCSIAVVVDATSGTLMGNSLECPSPFESGNP